MSKNRRWPAKAINLLVALAMVISLVAVLAPTVAAQEPDEECDPVEQFDGCHLEAFLNTYVKDADGAFTAVDEVAEYDCFYVNATVVNTGNESTTDPISATIDLGSIDATLSSCSGNTATQVATDVCEPGEMADFWWLACCTAASGTGTIGVTVTGGGDPACEASASILLTQTVPPAERCLEIKIIEAPGLNAQTGDPGWYDEEYPISPFEQTVTPCTNFGIKAKITNLCDETLNDVNGTISWTGPATLVGGDPADGWCVGDLSPGESTTVAWTLHCDDPGDVVVTVEAEENACAGGGAELDPISIYVNDPWTVHQQGAGNLVVTITQPPYDCWEKLTHCSPQFPIAATVTNNGDQDVLNVYVTVTGNDSATLGFVGSTIVSVGTLAPGASAPVSFTGNCKAKGGADITVTAQGLGGGGTLTATDMVSIIQKRIEAELPDVVESVGGPYYYIEFPTYANVCSVFPVVGSFFNATGTDLSLVNVTIHYRGNITLLGLEVGTEDNDYQPMYDRCLNYGWHAFDGSETGTAALNRTISGPDVDGYYSNTQQVQICDCCETRVKWYFQCVGTTPGDVYVSIDKTFGTPSVTVSDTSLLPSGGICEVLPRTITQEWKAHLYVGQFGFLQTECGAMLQRDAFAPCQDFHIVVPVINVGDADAEDVIVNFSLTPAPMGTTWDLQGITEEVSGDVVQYIFNTDTGVGQAMMGTVPSDSARKLILHLHCAAEGNVNFLIPSQGVTGIDENTGVAIPLDNIELPPCPLTIQQVPFTVTMVNPEECNTYNPGETFAVKALIHNGSQTDLEDVSATIHITGNAALVTSTPAQTATKYIGNCTSPGSPGCDNTLYADSYAEITWQLVCTGAGEVYIYVTAQSDDPILSTTSETVNVHQAYNADVDCIILSPGPGTCVATSEEMAVTVRVNSVGGTDAENVYVYLYVPYQMEILEGPDGAGSPYWTIGTMPTPSYQIATWTLHAVETGNYECDWSNSFGITAYVYADEPEIYDNEQGGNWYEKYPIWVYPAAHLTAEIGQFDTTIGTCDEFVVPYTIYNTGEADSWETSVTLSAFPADSVRIAEGAGGYTQYIGTIAGWGTNSSYTGYFTLHCKMPCETTITLTPAGNDECGFEPVQLWDDMNQVWVDDPGEWYHYGYLPGREISSEFIEPDSQTVKQIDSGGLDLAITKTVDDAFPAIEQTVTFTVTVTNDGPTAATGVAVSDAQPSGLSFQTATASQGTYSSGVWTVGSLAVGASATLKIPAVVNSTSEITNTATITGADQPDAFDDNDSASVTLNMEPTESWDIDLVTGWNLVSLPLIPDDGDDLDTFFAGIASNMDSIWAYDGGWTSWAPGWGGDLTEVTAQYGYWINMTAADTLSFTGVELESGTSVPPAYPVSVGWNLVGFKSTSPMAAGDYLNAMAGKWVRMYGYANGMYTAVQSDDMMVSGKGYWLAAIAAGTIYP